VLQDVYHCHKLMFIGAQVFYTFWHDTWKAELRNQKRLLVLRNSRQMHCCGNWYTHNTRTARSSVFCLGHDSSTKANRMTVWQQQKSSLANTLMPWHPYQLYPVMSGQLHGFSDMITTEAKTVSSDFNCIILIHQIKIYEDIVTENFV
jgi:hypothetical protein